MAGDRTAWRDEARKLVAAHGAISVVNRDVLRQTLVDLHVLFSEAPGDVERSYKGLPESLLSSLQRRQIDKVGSGSLGWTLEERHSGLDESSSIAASLGAQIRAVDWTLLRETSQFPGGVSGYLSPEKDFYVLPRRGVSKDRAPMTRQPYDKRGLLEHRIIPTFIDKYPVELIESRTLRLTESSSWTMGACVFKDLKPVPDFTGTGDGRRFVIKDVVCATADATIDEQMRSALDEECMVVMWPELTVPPLLRRRIETQLKSLDMLDRRSRPALVVAGTWHEPQSEGHVNRAYVYDGYGVQLTIYDKIDPYIDSDWGIEKIQLGQKLCVLVTEEALIGFAICLDFCAAKNPFTKLDVDLMLVPSLGNDTTMDSHQDTAKDMAAQFGSRSFVVQQITNTNFLDGRIGVILPPIQRPRSIYQKDMGQFNVWKSYEWPPAT